MNRTKVDLVNQKPARPVRPVPDADAVFEAIHTIMHLFRAGQYRALRDDPHELTHMEGKLLGYFARHPGATLRDLAAHLRQDKGQLARLVKSLRAHGLLAPHDDQPDRRSIRLHLTPEGLAIHRTLRRRVSRLSDLAIQGLSAPELRQINTLLQRIRTNLEV